MPFLAPSSFNATNHALETEDRPGCDVPMLDTQPPVVVKANKSLKFLQH